MTINEMIKYIETTHVTVADHEMLTEYLLRYRNEHPFSIETEAEMEQEFKIDRIEMYCEDARCKQEVIEIEEENAHNNPDHPAHHRVKEYFFSPKCSNAGERIKLNILLLNCMINHL